MSATVSASGGRVFPEPAPVPVIEGRRFVILGPTWEVTMTATRPETIVVTDTSPRSVIEAAIVQLRAKQDRMPSHWEQRRIELAGEIDRLVDRWLMADH